MTDEQAAAFRRLRALARPHRFRVVPDAEGFPMTPDRLGAVEWYDDSDLSDRPTPLPGWPTARYPLSTGAEAPRRRRREWG